MAIDQVKIDSNITGLRYAEETALGTPGTIWNELEPNSYNDFGGQLTTISRNPINPSRQRKKGVVADLDASGGFNTDLTQTNIQDLLQGFLFADVRKKRVQTITGIATNVLTVASETGYQVGDLVWIEKSAIAANNGKHTVSVVAAGAITVTPALTNEGSVGATVEIIGHVFLSGELSVDVSSGVYAKLAEAISFDATTKQLVPGEWIYIGGDTAGANFAQTVNNGFKRIKSIEATGITVDKSDATMVVDAGTSKTIEIYFGRVLKNEVGTLVKRRTYTLERLLGAPDSAAPSDIQAEYLNGATPNELSLNIPQAEKINVDLNFVATDNQQIAYNGTLLSDGDTIVPVVEADAFNTSSDFSRIKLAIVNSAEEAPVPLFAYATEMTLTINNNVTPNKAIAVLGAFDVTAGTFEVGGSLTVYFVDVAAIAAVRNNADITLDLVIAKANAGIAVDFPLVALGDGRANVEKDTAVTLPLSLLAATGAKVDANMNHTVLFTFWPYLPTVAEA